MKHGFGLLHNIYTIISSRVFAQRPISHAFLDGPNIIVAKTGLAPYVLLKYHCGQDSSVDSVTAQKVFRDSSKVVSRSIKSPTHAVQALTVKIDSSDTTKSMMY